MGISLTETKDRDYIKFLCALPGVWSRVSDGVSFSDFQPEISDRVVWVAVTKDENPIGVMMLEMDSSCSMIIHPYLSSKERKHGKSMMMEFYGIFCDKFPSTINKVNCMIPTCFPSVINFAKKVGFKVEGCSRESYYMNGTYHDRIILGITRKEICYGRNKESC